MAYSTISRSTDHFRTKLYAGNSTASRGITFDESANMKPDWVWIKERDDTINHYGFDAVRGATKGLSQNITNAEVTRDSTWFNSFDTNGFTIGAEDNINDTGDNYVAWCWKAANSSGSSNSDGSVTSTVSANTTAGFSIVKFNVGNSGGNITVGHGLGAAPKMIIIKSLADNYNWDVYVENVGNNKRLILNDTTTESSSTFMNNTSPTSSVFTFKQTHYGNNADAIAYCFKNITGYQKIGQYYGNGVAGDPYVYLGFKPTFLLIKNVAATQSWRLVDIKRNGFNPNNHMLYPNLSNAESTSEYVIDILSHGFRVVSTDAGVNGSSNRHIYLAIGQTAVGNNNIACTAR
tara:strand:+ start:1676 stop:2719 length:1044 start_codon:yes stop_codon:yes gene_type:complete